MYAVAVWPSAASRWSLSPGLVMMIDSKHENRVCCKWLSCLDPNRKTTSNIVIHLVNLWATHAIHNVCQWSYEERPKHTFEFGGCPQIHLDVQSLNRDFSFLRATRQTSTNSGSSGFGKRSVLYFVTKNSSSSTFNLRIGLRQKRASPSVTVPIHSVNIVRWTQ